MQKKHKAILLSAFLFPGLGQVHLGRKKIGFALAGIVLISFISMVMISTMRAMNSMLKLIEQGIIPDFNAILGIAMEASRGAGDPTHQTLFWIIILCWFLGIIDAWWAGTKLESQQS